MLSDEFPEWGNLSPLSIGGSATTVLIYFEDVDAVVDRAVSAGAKLLQPPTDQFWGTEAASFKTFRATRGCLQPARKTSPPKR